MTNLEILRNVSHFPELEHPKWRLTGRASAILPTARVNDGENGNYPNGQMIKGFRRIFSITGHLDGLCGSIRSLFRSPAIFNLVIS